jgi:hypothetical protein
MRRCSVSFDVYGKTKNIIKTTHSGAKKHQESGPRSEEKANSSAFAEADAHRTWQKGRAGC